MNRKKILIEYTEISKQSSWLEKTNIDDGITTMKML